jgi:acyl-CoA synthetase (AMP-forming)/AMP-acid ligase II
VAAVIHNRSEWVEADCAVSMVGGIRGRLNARDSLRELAWVLNDLWPSVVVTGPRHRQWVNIYRSILATIMSDVGPDSALLHVGPLSHQSGILTAPALLHGARSVMMTHFDPVGFFETVERERITHTILAPAIINALAHHPAAGAATRRVRAATGELTARAAAAGTVIPDVTAGDVMALVLGMRGLAQAAGVLDPGAWQRFLDIHLAGLRSERPPGRAPATGGVIR